MKGGQRRTRNAVRRCSPQAERRTKRIRCLLPTACCQLTARCLLPAACCLLISGCFGTPDAANIQLRKKNQQCEAERTKLELQHSADVATIRAYERQNGVSPMLPQDRLEKLFTTHDLSVGRLTGGHSAAGSLYDDGRSVYVVPTDDQEEAIKASGSFKVEAYDLKEAANPLVGTWTFDLDQARQLFYAHLSLYTYVLQCPWQTIPKHGDLTIHITFDDQLTGREFTAQQEVKTNPPSAPATSPATAP